MTILTYSRVRLQLAAALFALSAVLLLARQWLAEQVRPLNARPILGGESIEIVTLVAACIPLAILGRILYLLSSDMVAIKSLPEGLQVTSFFSRRVLPWDGILGGHRVNYGNVLSRNRWFNIRYLVAGANHTMRVPLILTKRPSGGQMSLPEKIDKACQEALGRPYTPGGERLPGTGIDHDAAIARYLKSKAEAQAAAAAAPLQTAPEETPARPQPVRPAFGRKGI